MNALTAAFLAALALATATRLWLAMRHIRHMQACRGEVPADFAGRISLEAHRKAADYNSDKTRLGVVHLLVDAAVLLALTLGGGLQWIWDFWGQSVTHPIGRGIAFVASVVVATGLVDLPLSVYRVFGVEARYGFNRMTLPMFLADLAKQALVGAALGLPLLAAALWAMQGLGELWWLYAWLGWMAFNLILLAVYPTWIAPIFNKFTPMEEGEMKSRVERLLARCGFRSDGLFVMDGSRRSTHGNAYFTGFGQNKRIVFFDTLLTRLNPPEVEAVLAHELGHFRLRHVTKRIAWTFTVSLAFLWLLGQLMQQPWFYAGLGVSTPSTAMALTLFAMVVPVFTFLFHPLASLYSRKHEFEADRYAAEHASADDLVHALVKLYQDNAATLTPDPLHSAFYDSHPPAALRIARLRAPSAG